MHGRVSIACAFISYLYVIVRPTTGTTAAAYRIQPALPAALFIASATDLSCPGICEPFPVPDPFGEGAYTIPRDCSTDEWPVWRYSLLWFGTPFGCHTLSVVSHSTLPGPGPVVYDCDANPIPATGGTFTMGSSPRQCGSYTVATESTTWGAVKALYR